MYLVYFSYIEHSNVFDFPAYSFLYEIFFMLSYHKYIVDHKFSSFAGDVKIFGF